MRKWVKRLAIAAAIGCLLLLLAALALPLVLRGGRLAALVERATDSLCGTIRIDGGRLGSLAVFDLLLGRPTPIELEGLRAVAADGDEVLFAGRASARVSVRRQPFALDVHDLRLRSVRWRFIEHRQGRVDFIDMFRPIPAGGTRAQCTAPRPRPAVRPAPAPAPGPPRPRRSLSLRVHDATLEELDLGLDFSTWGLELRGTGARGGISFVDGPGGQRLSFEVREVGASRGGTLRIGGRNARWAAVIPFDGVQIDRFATDPAAPADMLLEVARAATGRSVLSGRARFSDVLWGRRSRWAGIDLDARWNDAGDAVEALKKAWGLSQRLPGRLDGDVTVRLQGPFNALAGRVQAVGRNAQLDMGLDRQLRVDASLQVDDIETEGVLDRGLVPMFGGRLSGKVKVRGQLAPEILGVWGELEEATLRLDRRRRGPFPARFNLSTRAVPGPATADELDVYLARVRFSGGTLAVPDLRASMPGALVRGGVTAQLYDPTTGRLLVPPVFEAHTNARELDLARLIPGGLVRGRLSFSSVQRGPADDLAVSLRFPPGTVVQVATQSLQLPLRLEARLRDGDELTVSTFRLGDPATGALELGGRLVFDGALDGRLAILSYPLEKAVTGARIRLTGRIDGEVVATGEVRRPRLAGRLAFSEVRAGRTLLGDGGLTFAPARGGTAIEGRPVPPLALSGRLSAGPRPVLTARLSLDRMPIDPFVEAIPGLTGRLSGRAELRGQGRRFDVSADLDELAVDYRLPITGFALDLRNTRPVHLEASEREVRLAPAALRGRGIEAVTSARYDATGMDANVEATLALAPLAEALGPLVKETAGVLGVALQARGPARAPAISGTLVVREPLRIWPSMLLVPLQVPGGRVSFRDDTFEAQGLALSVASAGLQLDGRLHLDRGQPGHSRLDARIAGTVDGGALARRLPKVLDEAHGRIAAHGRLGGTVAVPTLDGQIDFQAFGVTVPGGPVQLRSLDGRIEARGKTLVTRGLTAQLGPSGRLQIGSPEAPALIELASLDPPQLSRLSAQVRGQNLATVAPISGLQLRDLDLQLGLEHALAGPLRIAGDVWIRGATLLPAKMRPPSAAPRLRAGGARVARDLFPAVTLDVGVHSPDGALEVVIPYLPDVSVTLDCRLVGPLRRPRVNGRAHGDGVYSRLAIWLYDLFTDAHVRRCGAK